MILGFTTFSDGTSCSTDSPQSFDMSQMYFTGAKFDNFRLENDGTFNFGNNYSPDWTDTTSASTDFQNTINASNVDFITADTTGLLIKRSTDEYSWQTIYYKEILTSDDFNFITYDKTNRSNTTYYYVIVPILGNTVGAEMEATSVYSEFDGLFLVEPDAVVGSIYDNNITYSRINNASVVNTIGSKYPVVVRNGLNDYQSGSATARFLVVDKDSEEFMLNEEYQHVEDVSDCLNNGVPKIMKWYDGSIRLVDISGEISHDNSEYWAAPKTTFSWTQIGDADDIEDLCDNGFMDIPIEYR